MKIRTNIKAGDHCWVAAQNLIKNPGDGSYQKAFCECCAKDPMCLR